ncbi:MAG: hypothetical protein ACRCST_17545 [Turicibacter sp.]
MKIKEEKDKFVLSLKIDNGRIFGKWQPPSLWTNLVTHFYTWYIQVALDTMTSTLSLSKVSLLFLNP